MGPPPPLTHPHVYMLQAIHDFSQYTYCLKLLATSRIPRDHKAMRVLAKTVQPIHALTKFFLANTRID